MCISLFTTVILAIIMTMAANLEKEIKLSIILFHYIRYPKWLSGSLGLLFRSLGFIISIYFVAHFLLWGYSTCYGKWFVNL